MAQFSHIVFVARPNEPLVPTRNGEAPLLAEQRRRYAWNVDGRHG
jgi:hypothetical protein